MKINKDFIITKIDGANVVVPNNSDISFDAIMTLNDTGVFLFEMLKNDCTREELVKAMLQEYDISEDIAAKDIDEFLAKLEKLGILNV